MTRRYRPSELRVYTPVAHGPSARGCAAWPSQHGRGPVPPGRRTAANTGHDDTGAEPADRLSIVACYGSTLLCCRRTAALAMDTAYPYESEHRPQVPPVRTPGPTLPDSVAALDWLDSERHSYKQR